MSRKKPIYPADLNLALIAVTDLTRAAMEWESAGPRRQALYTLCDALQAARRDYCAAVQPNTPPTS